MESDTFVRWLQQERALSDLRQQREDMGRVPRVLTMTDDEIATYVLDLRDKLDSGSFSVRRWVLQQVIERVDIGDEMVITFKMPSSV